MLIIACGKISVANSRLKSTRKEPRLISKVDVDIKRWSIFLKRALQIEALIVLAIREPWWVSALFAEGEKQRELRINDSGV